MAMMGANLRWLNQKSGLKFKTGFRNQVPRKVLTNQVLQIMKNQAKTWKIDNKLFTTQQWALLFEYISACQVEVLLINDNNRPEVIKEIKGVQFLQLKELNLSKNGITNVQQLAYLKTNSLLKLDISNNQITTIRALSKLNSPIRILKIQNNPINDVQRLSRSSFTELRQLTLEMRSRENVIGESVSWVFKLPTAKLDQLHCAGRTRMKESNLFRQLGRRFVGGKIALS